jgi:putative toxin-antitoxin system antitoxin component (TIGR02293 family)
MHICIIGEVALYCRRKRQKESHPMPDRNSTHATKSKKSGAWTGRKAASGMLAKTKPAKHVGSGKFLKALPGYSKLGMLPVSTLIATDSIESNSTLDDLVKDGLPLEMLDKAKDLIQLMVEFGVLPRKTIEDAKKSKKVKLSTVNSERIVRMVRMLDQTAKALGQERALEWIKKPNKNFGGNSAIEMAKTESGARAVEHFLRQLSHGFAA